MAHTLLLQKLNPDADGLIRALSQHVNDSMLMEIAIADYGEDVELNMTQLRRIRNEQVVLAPMPWNPKEVLRLMHWTELDTGSTGQSSIPDDVRRQHLIRAFVCAVLLRATADPLNNGYFEGDNSSIAGLLESLPTLDATIQAEALRYFAWHVQQLMSGDSETPFYYLALLILVLRMKAVLTPAELYDMIEWISIEVKVAREGLIRDSTMPEQWLTWLTYFNQRHSIWLALGREIAALADQYGQSEIQQALKALASHLDVYEG
jgi:hypothetical protein